MIGSGSRNETAVELSKRILNHYDNDLNKLGKASINELSNFKGIGEAKAISIIAALEIGRRRNDAESKAPDIIVSSKDAYNIMRRHLVDLNHEEFWIILTGRSSKVLGKELVSKGGFSNTLIDLKIIFSLALQYKSNGIILVHNHPSGSLKPSYEDLNLTKRIADAGNIIDIKILDHLIITDDSFYSFADNGLF
jgi:DNA repair protein RadC